MTCTCDNPAKVWDERRLTARKTYACEECHHPIAAGEVYARVGALHEGGWGTFRFCLFCLAFAREAKGLGVCYEIGQLYSDVLGWLYEQTYLTSRGLARVSMVDGDTRLLNELHGAEVHDQ